VQTAVDTKKLTPIDVHIIVFYDLM